MRRLLFALALVVAATALAVASDNREYGARSVARSKGTVSKACSVGGHTRSTSAKCTTCERDPNGHIKRDPAARRAFQHQHPCPATGTGACRGYVVDHIISLKCSGADAPDNMAWQTRAAAKAKDKIE